VTAAFFVMALPHSDAFFVRAYPKGCTESFQDGHCKAFAYFGGVPTRISYDNSKVAVAAVAGARGRTPTREFLRLASHFLFGYRFCRVRWRRWRRRRPATASPRAAPGTPPAASRAAPATAGTAPSAPCRRR